MRTTTYFLAVPALGMLAWASLALAQNPAKESIGASSGAGAAEEKVEDPWADDLILRAVTRIGGKFVVHVENTKLIGDEDPEKRRQAHRRLVEGQADGNLRIQSVKPHRDASQVEVVLASGSGSSVKTATVKYSDKQLKSKSAPAAKGRPTPGRPTTNRATTQRKPATTTKRSTTPGKRRVILPPGLQGK